MNDDAEFDGDGRLVSRRYGDVYFSGDGVAETEHVFVAGNALAPRLEAHSGAFVIGETGFGTGLNFLVAWRTLLDAGSDARLSFVSTEAHPLPGRVLETMHARLPASLQPLAAELRRAWDEHPARPLRTTFADGRVQLCVLNGDALASLRSHTFAADAWFLDGFAPAKNPAMWSDELLEEIAHHTRAGGTFATYTVAGTVRRGLTAAGFAIERAPGHGHKREMLHGRLDAANAPATAPTHITTAPRRVLVHGAGIAGASAAHAFAERGVDVVVCDPHGLAAGASGIAAAAVRPRLWLPGDASVPDAELVAHAFRFAVPWLEAHAPSSFRRSGALLAASDAAEADALRRRADNPATSDFARWCEPDEAAMLAGVALPFGAVYIEAGGNCDLAATVHELLDHAAIACVTERPADAFDLEVVATAAPLGDVTALRRTQPARGQAIAIKSSRPPRAVICTSGYLCPPVDGGATWIGSTYDRDDVGADLRLADDARVKQKFATLPALVAVMRDAEVVARFAAVRSTSADRVPLVGPLDGGTVRLATLAHGSRGSITAPFAAELLAAFAFAEPLPIQPDLWRRMQPRRVIGN